jgi:sensor histidine kinase YesM
MFAFTRSFSKRVEKLIHKIKVAETGDLSITEKIEGNDEIAVLDRQFNTMLGKLDTLIKKNYIQQLEKKESEFRNLQLQINPHFLYNTLETISSIAAVKGVFLICDLCEKLGGNFRYSLGKNYGEFVTVKQELVHTQNYVYIQKTRFENKFDVFYNVDPEMEDKLVLRFILQPIVENAIVHGLSNNKGKGTLEISIKEINHMLVIKIEDDGAGMSQQKVEEISNYINDTHQTEQTRQGIGIRNVNQRIQLACGIEYGITIESLQGRGSCFTITLPLLQ